MEAHVTLNGILARVREATLELHHFESNEADWNLVVQLDGDLPELRVSGTVVTPTAVLRSRESRSSMSRTRSLLTARQAG